MGLKIAILKNSNEWDKSFWDLSTQKESEFVISKTRNNKFESEFIRDFSILKSASISQDQGDVIAYYVQSNNPLVLNNIKFGSGAHGIVIVPSVDVSGIKFPVDSTGMFMSMERCRLFNLSSFLVGAIETANGMFRGCKQNFILVLNKILRMGSLKSARAMFADSGITSTDRISIESILFKKLSEIDTAAMFKGCKSLKYVSFGEYSENPTNSVIVRFKEMFSGCENLEYVNTGMTCVGSTVYAEGFDNSAFFSDSLESVFKDCKKLQFIIMPNVDTEKVAFFKEWISGVPDLRFISLKNFAAKNRQESETPFVCINNHDIISQYLDTGVPGWILSPKYYFSNYNTVSAVCDMLSRQLGEDNDKDLNLLYPRVPLACRGLKIVEDSDIGGIDSSIISDSEDAQLVAKGMLDYCDGKVVASVPSGKVISLVQEIDGHRYSNWSGVPEVNSLQINDKEIANDISRFGLNKSSMMVFGQSYFFSSYINELKNLLEFNWDSEKLNVYITAFFAVFAQNWRLREKLFTSKQISSGALEYVKGVLTEIWKNVDGIPDQAQISKAAVVEEIMSAGLDEQTNDLDMVSDFMDLGNSSALHLDMSEDTSKTSLFSDTDLFSGTDMFADSLSMPDATSSLLEGSDIGDFDSNGLLDIDAELDDSEFKTIKKAEISEEMLLTRDIITSENINHTVENVTDMDIDDMF